MERTNKPWTPEDDRQLTFLWGVLDIAAISQRLGRSVRGCGARAEKLKLGRTARGFETLEAFCQRTGYYRTTVYAAARRIGRRIPYAARSHLSKQAGNFGRTRVVDDELATLLIEALNNPPEPVYKMAEWGAGSLPEACLECAETSRKHVAKGLCRRCYSRVWSRKARGK